MDSSRSERRVRVVMNGAVGPVLVGLVFAGLLGGCGSSRQALTAHQGRRAQGDLMPFDAAEPSEQADAPWSLMRGGRRMKREFFQVDAAGNHPEPFLGQLEALNQIGAQ